MEEYALYLHVHENKSFCTLKRIEDEQEWIILYSDEQIQRTPPVLNGMALYPYQEGYEYSKDTVGREMFYELLSFYSLNGYFLIKHPRDTHDA